MLLDMDITIALKNFYGSYDIKSFSLFESSKINEKFPSLKLKTVNKGISIEVKCSICGNFHCYRYSFYEIIKGDLIVGGCEALGMPLFYIGNYDKVKQKVDRCNNVNKSLYAMM
ncbi:hypothetical protein HBE96_02405 [Clostridium sp. P21]|uniref:Uncharacterized protein n=1 Tax=Clostridium muellerianum TaxID=2716538 RepID=A0A7Y0EDL6_9CLOT|nr:hypothetical protein [Clostridium muellerianum]NMM61564.1 hypothetical protein [Clostridium muellerianum]